MIDRSNCLPIILCSVIIFFLVGCSTKDNTKNLTDNIRVALRKKGCDANSGSIEYVDENCSVNARVVDGGIQICNKFFNYEFRDQVSIIWHEVFHLNNDKPSGKSSLLLEDPVYIENVSVDIIDYINNVVNADLEDYSKQIAYNRMISLSEIRDSVYYENEIAAYQQEINTIKDVSPQYDAERKFMLWKHTASLDIAKKYLRK